MCILSMPSMHVVCLFADILSGNLRFKKIDCIQNAMASDLLCRPRSTRKKSQEFTPSTYI